MQDEQQQDETAVEPAEEDRTATDLVAAAVALEEVTDAEVVAIRARLIELAREAGADV